MIVKIEVDVEGKELITGLCDIALKANGIRNLPGVSTVLCGLKLIGPPYPKQVAEKKENEKP